MRKELTHELRQLENYKILNKRLLNTLYRERLASFKTKSRKLATLIAKQGHSYKSSTYSTALTNLLSIELTSDEINQFTFELHYSFVDDKNKNMKKYLVANFKSSADKITENLDSHKREDFHEFIRVFVDTLQKMFMQQQIMHINI